MWDLLSWLFFIVFIAGLIVVAGLLVRGYLNTGAASGNPFSGALFAPKPDKRLDVVEQANLDGRRKLVLIRRDHVEHLIMTGGPVDVVLETGIETSRDLRRMAEGASEPAAPATRLPRRFSSVANE